MPCRTVDRAGTIAYFVSRFWREVKNDDHELVNRRRRDAVRELLRDSEKKASFKRVSRS